MIAQLSVKFNGTCEANLSIMVGIALLQITTSESRRVIQSSIDCVKMSDKLVTFFYSKVICERKSIKNHCNLVLLDTQTRSVKTATTKVINSQRPNLTWHFKSIPREESSTAHLCLLTLW